MVKALTFRKPYWIRHLALQHVAKSLFRRVDVIRAGIVSLRSHSSASGATHNVSRIRNIGIIAHIDAGKTTTTERMLYYSGHTRRIGDVDDGSTVTDFLPAERARGITIQSAAITFHWPPKNANEQTDEADLARQVQQGKLPMSSLTHQINLIDTPGHADFTFEVRRSLRILDGAVCILDGVAGVEAQTEQVWKQAAQWRIPRIAFINKLDRDGAAFGRTVREIGMRLGGWPAVCQIPWWEGGNGRFTGIADAVQLQGLYYQAGGDGKQVQSFSLAELGNVNAGLQNELKDARVALVELLSEHDDLMVEAFLEADEDHLAVTPVQILSSLRRLLRLGNDIIPVFAGASFRNIGVQPLLNAVVDLLPPPEERPDPEISIGDVTGSLGQLFQGDLLATKADVLTTKRQKTAIGIPNKKSLQALEGCALAFKVVNDPRRGVLVYIRVYSGSINRSAMLFNTNLKVSEKASTLLRMYASDSVPVQSIEAGQIGVIAGSKFARTGDTLVAYQGNKASPPAPLDSFQLRPIDVPSPVFFASIEPNSLREERDVHQKLSLLLREDPSLQVSSDQDTGQTLLSGMGELHLEIACDRLVSELKANASMGKIAISYRETLNTSSEQLTRIFDRDRSDAKGKAGCMAVASPLQDHTANELLSKNGDDNALIHRQDGNVIVISAPSLDEEGRPMTSEDVGLPPNLSLHDVQTAYLNGALAALGRGPKYSYPMRNTKVVLTLDPANHIFGNESTISALTSAARLATIAALKDAAAKGGTTMMEPVMNVDITVDESSLGSVAQDISTSRGGHIMSLGDETQTTDSPDRPAIDVQKIYAPRDPFESDGSLHEQGNHVAHLTRTLSAKVPLKEMVGYLKHLRSITGGRGTFVMNVDRFEKMTAQREKAAIAELEGTG